MMGIRGFKLERFINDCCQRRIEKFNRTMMMVRNGVFEENEIITNLNFRQPIPFIDDDIKPEGTLLMMRIFQITIIFGYRFCEMQHANFQVRFQEKLEQMRSLPKQLYKK